MWQADVVLYTCHQFFENWVNLAYRLPKTSRCYHFFYVGDIGLVEPHILICAVCPLLGTLQLGHCRRTFTLTRKTRNAPSSALVRGKWWSFPQWTARSLAIEPHFWNKVLLIAHATFWQVIYTEADIFFRTLVMFAECPAKLTCYFNHILKSWNAPARCWMKKLWGQGYICVGTPLMVMTIAVIYAKYIYFYLFCGLFSSLFSDKKLHAYEHTYDGIFHLDITFARFLLWESIFAFVIKLVSNVYCLMGTLLSFHPEVSQKSTNCSIVITQEKEDHVLKQQTFWLYMDT